MLRGLCVTALVFACSASAADARVTVAVKDPVAHVEAGARLRVQYTVRNPARTTAKAATAKVALVRGRTVIALTTGRVPRIAPRRAKTLTVRGVVPSRAGAYRVRVCVGRVCKQSRRSVRVTVPAPPAPAPAPPQPTPTPVPAPADTTPPAAPVLTSSGFQSAAMTGATLHYRAGASGSFTVTASVDADVTGVEFASLGQGWLGGGSDTTRPFTATYTFALLSAPPAGPLTAVAFDAAGNASSPARLSVVGDGAGPALTLTCEPDDCTGEVSLSAADAGSGVAAILYSLDGSEPVAPYTTPFLAQTETPLRARAVDRVGNVGPELARNVGPPPTQFAFTFGEGVNAAGDDASQTAWTRPGVAGSLRVRTDDVSDVEWPQLGAGWTVEPDDDGALFSFTAGAAAPLIVPVEADDGALRSFFRLRHDGTPPTAPAIACDCDGHSTVGVEIALSAADGDSGVAQILYSLDGSEPSTVYSRPFTAYHSGMLRTRALDRVGNAGPIATRTLSIDVSGDPTPPTVPELHFSQLEGVEVVEGNLRFTPGSPQRFVLEASANDNQSGIASITYPDIAGWTRTSAGNGVAYERGPSAEESGPHVVRATNHAGASSEASFRIEAAG